MGTATRTQNRRKNTGGYRRRQRPRGMKDAEFIAVSNKIKRIEKDIEIYEAAKAEQVIVDYPCEVTGKKQHTFQPFWTCAPKARTRPPDMILPHEKQKAA